VPELTPQHPGEDTPPANPLRQLLLQLASSEDVKVARWARRMLEEGEFVEVTDPGKGGGKRSR
jgi:hypothetical protein